MSSLSVFDEVQLSLFSKSVSGSGFPLEYQGLTDEELPFYKVSSLGSISSDGFIGGSENSISRDTARILGSSVISAGSILLAKIGEAIFLSRFAMTRLPSCIDNNMLALEIDPKLADPRFVLYALNTLDVSLLVNPGPVPSLSVKGLGRFRIPLPDLTTQQRIAEYLDTELGEMDAMVARLEKLIADLEARRKTVITEKVTGQHPSERVGVDNYTFDEVQLSLFSKSVSGSGFPLEYQGLTDEELPFYKVSSLGLMSNDGFMGDAVNSISRDTAQILRAPIISAGSILLAKIGEAIFLARFAITTRPSCIDNNMLALEIDQKLANPRFVLYALNTLDVSLLVNPGPVPSLSVKGLGHSRIPLPDLDTQRRIAAELDEETAAIDGIIARSRTLIDDLKARKSALITEVVTGRKQV